MKSLQTVSAPTRLVSVGNVAFNSGGTAFEVAYREHATALVRLAWLMTSSKEQAEGVVHEVFLRYQRVDPPPLSTWSYLRRMAINQIIDDSRRAATEVRYQPEPVLEFGDPELDETWEIVCSLPDQQRRALILRYYADLPLSEIALVMNVPLGTVKSHIHRGLERLKEMVT